MDANKPGPPRRPWTLSEWVAEAEASACPRCHSIETLNQMSDHAARACTCDQHCGFPSCGGPRPEPDRDLRDGWGQDGDEDL